MDLMAGGGIRLGDNVMSKGKELGDWFAAVPDSSAAEGFSAARRLMSERVDARVIIGGKMGVLSDPGDVY